MNKNAKMKLNWYAVAGTWAEDLYLRTRASPPPVKKSGYWLVTVQIYYDKNLQ